jgi:hypothetical protein
LARAALVAVVLAAAACALAVPAARADGDPASDVLLTQDVYIPYYVKLPKASTDELSRVAKQAQARGYRIRVALIGNKFDLGSVGVFWEKPAQYAKFLGQELSVTGLYKDRVLTVMPSGYGISRNGETLPDEQRVLDALPSPDARKEDIATAALSAVQKLAAAQGVQLSVVKPEPASSGGWLTSDRLKIAAAALTLLAIGIGIEVARRVRRSRGAEGMPSP